MAPEMGHEEVENYWVAIYWLLHQQECDPGINSILES